MTDPSHIAIIGCGFTGTSAFFQLVDRYPVSEITIFESSGEFGPGYPYRADDCPDYLLNNTNDSLCLVPGNRRAFLNWLETKPEIEADPDPRGHLPRKVFGAFLSDVFNATRVNAAVKGIKVNLIPFEALSMSELDDGRLKVGWRDGEMIADAALLTTGRCPDIDPYDAPPIGSSALYIANHVRTDLFDRVRLDAKVHVLGSSLSAFDVINRLFSDDTGCRFVEGENGTLSFEPGPNSRHVVLCSRSGRLKALQSRTPGAVERCHFTAEALARKATGQGLSLNAVTESILREAADHGVELSVEALLDPYAGCESAVAVNTRAADLLEDAIVAASNDGHANFLVDLFADAQIDLWDGWAARLLNPEEETIYRSKFESAFLTYGAPCPISTARKLLALLRAGHLTIRRGVQSVDFCEKEDAYVISHAEGRDIADVLVNTTCSLDRNVESENQSPLIRDLVATGLLGSDNSSAGRSPLGAAVDMKSFRSMHARNVYVVNMMLWGPGFFTSSAFMMALVVERLLKEMFSGGSRGVTESTL